MLYEKGKDDKCTLWNNKYFQFMTSMGLHTKFLPRVPRFFVVPHLEQLNIHTHLIQWFYRKYVQMYIERNVKLCFRPGE